MVIVERENTADIQDRRSARFEASSRYSSFFLYRSPTGRYVVNPECEFRILTLSNYDLDLNGLMDK